MKHFSIIIPQIFHCECRDPVIPFNSNLLCIQHHIYLSFAGYGLCEKSMVPNQPVYAWSYKLFFSFLCWKNTTVSCKMQPNIPTPLQVVGEKVTPHSPSALGFGGVFLWYCWSPKCSGPLNLLLNYCQCLFICSCLLCWVFVAALGPFLAAVREGATFSLWSVGFSSTGFACCQAGARGHMDFRSCGSRA